jgi:hypothetical protein
MAKWMIIEARGWTLDELTGEGTRGLSGRHLEIVDGITALYRPIQARKTKQALLSSPGAWIVGAVAALRTPKRG